MIQFQTDVDFERSVQVYDEWFTHFARLRWRLAERGITFHPTQGDLTFADARCVPSAEGPPMVLYDRTDGGFLWWVFQPRGDIARRWLATERVRGLIKISRYSGLEFYNQPATDESVHAQRVRVSSAGRLDPAHSPPRPLLDERTYRKLLLSPGFWAFDVCGPQVERPLDVDQSRSLDVFCAGTIRYDCAAISWHRSRALEELGKLERLRVFLGRGRVLPLGSYHHLLRQARICVSPWGWGETCFRDYEALLAGCVLIKPRTDFVHTLLPLDESHYVACEPDFSDLRERIEQVLRNWNGYREQRFRNREYVLQARDEDRLADQWAQAFQLAAAN